MGALLEKRRHRQLWFHARSLIIDEPDFQMTNFIRVYIILLLIYLNKSFIRSIIAHPTKGGWIMSPVLNSILGISIIFLCTTLGSSFVFFLKRDSITPKLNRIFMGFAAGIMLSASVFSLIMPALETEVTYMPNYALVAIAVLAGAGFLWGIDKLTPHIHSATNEEEGPKANKISRTTKMFMAVTIHNIPEGLSVGIAYGVALAAVAAGLDSAAGLP